LWCFTSQKKERTTVKIAPILDLRHPRSIPAETFEKALTMASAGASISSAAESLDVRRSTLRDRLEAHESFDLPKAVKDALVTPDGERFLARFSIALHVHARNMCACGLRVLSNLLRDAGLAPFLGTSVAAQWELAQAIDKAIVTYGEEQQARMAPALAGKEITLALDENFHEGPCLVGIEPGSNFVAVEKVTDARGVDDWKGAMQPVLASLGVRVTQVTSDSGAAILALAESVLGAHHSPDLFHILYDFRRSFAPSLRSVRRQLEGQLKAIEQELATLERMAARWDALTPEERGRGRAPDIERRRKEQEQKFNTVTDALAQFLCRDAQVTAALKSMSVEYHPVNLATGRRTGAKSLRETADKALAAINKVVADCELAHGAPEAVLKLERMASKMVATLEFVESSWRRRAAAVTDDPKQRYALEAWLAPAAYLDRVASRATTLRAHELCKQAEVLRDAAQASIGEDAVAALEPVARTMALDFQRSSSMVEGRNGQLSLRHHAFHELSPLKRGVLTTLHNYVLTREDGSTAAERLSGVKPEPLMDWLCERIISVPGGRPKRIFRNAS
jgi:hypothetical protein